MLSIEKAGGNTLAFSTMNKSKNHAGWEIQQYTSKGWVNRQIDKTGKPRIYKTPPKPELDRMKVSGDGKEYRIYESLHQPL